MQTWNDITLRTLEDWSNMFSETSVINTYTPTKPQKAPIIHTAVKASQKAVSFDQKIILTTMITKFR
jgi:hypothetical protein